MDEDHHSDTVRTWTFAVKRPEVERGARRPSSDGFSASVSCCCSVTSQE